MVTQREITDLRGDVKGCKCQYLSVKRTKIKTTVIIGPMVKES